MNTPAPHGGSLAVGRPDDSLLTGVLVAAVVLLLLFLLVRHLVKRLGGWRRCRRRIAREAALTRRAFGEPLRALRRHRRGVRALGRQLAEPRTGLLVRRLLDAAAGALGEAPGAVPYALRLTAASATVQIAARRLPEPLAPWENGTGSGPQAWTLALGGDGELPEAAPRLSHRARPLPVAVGMADGACVHLDLAAGPRLVTVEGDQAARLRLLQALAAQLDRPGSGVHVTVADGVHPGHHGPRLDAVLRRLERSPAGEPDDLGGTATVEAVVCAAPTVEQARRLAGLTASAAVVCLVDGRAAAHSWALRVDGRGRVTAPELGLDADSGPLGRAVAAAVRADRRRSRRTTADRPVPQRGQSPRPPELPEEPSRSAPEPVPAAARAATGPDLLSEPATAGERPTAASSTGSEG